MIVSTSSSCCVACMTMTELYYILSVPQQNIMVSISIAFAIRTYKAVCSCVNASHIPAPLWGNLHPLPDRYVHQAKVVRMVTSLANKIHSCA